MTIRKILAPVGGEGEGDALNIALALGRRFGAHVEILHAGTDVREAVAFVGEGMTAAMIEQIMQAAAADSRERGAKARALAERAMASSGAPGLDSAKPGFSAGFVEMLGREDELVAAWGRLADLVVMPKPSGAVSATLQAALRETGRPVLIVPAGTPIAFGRRIAIGWNGSIEAGRALAAALPFLGEAEEVRVLSVEEPGRIGLPGGAVVEYLAWHGVQAKAEHLSTGPFGVGRALLAGLGEGNSDMLVLGAYSRSQMRRLIFGGVTGEVLTHIGIPALMVH
jgi:nucleotide-binding universal stress UspA family protein